MPYLAMHIKLLNIRQPPRRHLQHRKHPRPRRGARAARGKGHQHPHQQQRHLPGAPSQGGVDQRRLHRPGRRRTLDGPRRRRGLARGLRRQRRCAPLLHGSSLAFTPQGRPGHPGALERHHQHLLQRGHHQNALAGPVRLLVQQGRLPAPDQGVGAHVRAAAHPRELYRARIVPDGDDDGDVG